MDDPAKPEPLSPDWSPGARSPRVDDGLVLDPDAPLSPFQTSERLSLRSLTYTGTRFPYPVLHDSAQALETHPDVVLMTAAFLIVERSGNEPWTPGGGLQATAHDARRTLAFALAWWEPRNRGLIPYDAETDVDAHTVVAENTSPALAEVAAFAEAAVRLRADRRLQPGRGPRHHFPDSPRPRLLRGGPDGPEGPRLSDINTHAPGALHPHLDEHGALHFEEPAEDQAAF